MQTNLVSDEILTELQARGQKIYDSQFKSELEPSHNGEYIVIHVETKNYAVARTYRDASRAMRARHPRDGKLVGFKIGPEPDSDDLTARILLAELRGNRVK